MRKNQSVCLGGFLSMGKNNAFYWTTALLIGNEGYTNVLRWNFIQPVSGKKLCLR